MHIVHRSFFTIETVYYAHGETFLGTPYNVLHIALILIAVYP